MKTKYIIFNETLPIIFGEYFSHDTVKIAGQTPTSAGFFKVNEKDEVETYGKSLGLKMGPKPDDAFILTNALKKFKNPS